MYFPWYFPLNAPPGRENSRGKLDPANLAFSPQTNKTNRIFSVAEKSCKALGGEMTIYEDQVEKCISHLLVWCLQKFEVCLPFSSSQVFFPWHLFASQRHPFGGFIASRRQWEHCCCYFRHLVFLVVSKKSIRHRCTQIFIVAAGGDVCSRFDQSGFKVWESESDTGKVALRRLMVKKIRRLPVDMVVYPMIYRVLSISQVVVLGFLLLGTINPKSYWRFMSWPIIIHRYAHQISEKYPPGTNISPEKSILKMIFLFPRWNMLVPYRVTLRARCFVGHDPHVSKNPIRCWDFIRAMRRDCCQCLSGRQSCWWFNYHGNPQPSFFRAYNL